MKSNPIENFSVAYEYIYEISKKILFTSYNTDGLYK